MARKLFIFIILLTLASCRSVKYVPVEKVVKEYVNRTDTFIRTDSVYVGDSTVIYMDGDTVFVDRWHTRYRDRWRDRVLIDSFIRTDSVQVPYPVEKSLTWWQQAKIDFSEYMISTLLIVIVILVVRRWLQQRLKRQNDE